MKIKMNFQKGKYRRVYINQLWFLMVFFIDVGIGGIRVCMSLWFFSGFGGLVVKRGVVRDWGEMGFGVIWTC